MAGQRRAPGERTLVECPAALYQDVGERDPGEIPRSGKL